MYMKNELQLVARLLFSSLFDNLSLIVKGGERPSPFEMKRCVEKLFLVRAFPFLSFKSL